MSNPVLNSELSSILTAFGDGGMLFSLSSLPSVPKAEGAVGKKRKYKNEEEKVAKRLQVPKACTNCRKMHAGCDTQRPCLRCVQQGISGTCMDVPRKKRESKKKKGCDHEPEAIMEQCNSQLSTPENGTPSWEDNLLDALDAQPFIQTNEELGHLDPPLFSADQFQPFESDEFSPSDEQTPISRFVYSLTEQPFQPANTPSANPFAQFGSEELSFLLQQITELREDNRNLAQKLVGVTEELLKIKKTKTPQPKPNLPISLNTAQLSQKSREQLLSGWHSFAPQPDVAISVWKATNGGNLLVECNDKFVELLGYPVETLKNNFSCRKLVPKDTHDYHDQRQWPKRTKILTAHGLKEVFITITPIHGQGQDGQFFILHISEI